MVVVKGGGGEWRNTQKADWLVLSICCFHHVSCQNPQAEPLVSVDFFCSAVDRSTNYGSV